MNSSSRTLKLYFLLALGFLLACAIIIYFILLGDDEPSYSAKIWLEAVSIGDTETALGLTCAFRIVEVEKILQDNLTRNINNIDLSQINFKTTIVEAKKTAIVEASGKISLEINQNIVEGNISYNWMFVYEGGKWRWCGNYNEERPNYSLIISVVALSLFIMFLSILFAPQRQRKGEDITRFIGPLSPDEFNENSILQHLDSFDTGEVVSIDKRTGDGVIEAENGEQYSMNIGQIIGKGNRNINIGEDVLFQKGINSRERKVKNILIVNDESEENTQFSKWLKKLAHETTKLRWNLNSYNSNYINKKLNNCNAYLELLNEYARTNNIKLDIWEVVVSNVVKRDLKKIFVIMEEKSKKASWWAGLLSYVLKLISIFADILEIVSPGTAELLRLVGKSVGRLLNSPKKPPQIGPGDDE